MQKGKIIENIKFLIKQYEKDIENKNNEFLPEEIEDFDKIKDNQSDSSLYHLAGDSIVVNVLMAIFKEMI